MKELKVFVVETGDKSEESERKRDDFFCLRYENYVEDLKWEKENPSKRETDKWDEYSDFILVYLNKQLAGGCRIIHHTIPFPLEELISQGVAKLYPNEKIGKDSFKISRFIVRKHLGLTGIRVGRILYQEIYKHIVEKNKMRYCYAIMQKNHLRYLKWARKIQFRKIGNSFPYKEIIFVPVEGFSETIFRNTIHPE